MARHSYLGFAAGICAFLGAAGCAKPDVGNCEWTKLLGGAEPSADKQVFLVVPFLPRRDFQTDELSVEVGSKQGKMVAVCSFLLGGCGAGGKFAGEGVKKDSFDLVFLIDDDGLNQKHVVIRFGDVHWERSAWPGSEFQYDLTRMIPTKKH